MEKEYICDIGKGEGMLDLKIRKKTQERAMSSVVRCFRDKIMFRKLDLVKEVKEQYQEERDGTGLVDTNVSSTVQLLMREVLR